MSHHSDKKLSDELLACLEFDLENQAKALHLGTIEDSFADGKIQQDDKGDFDFAISNAAGRVVVNFGTPVSWIALTQEQARNFALLLRSQAKKAKHDKDEV